MQRLSQTLFAILVAGLVAGLVRPAPAANDDAAVAKRGQAIYESSCAHCHGDEGQGVEDEFSQSLAGDLTIARLTELISETMPEDDPESCAGEDATAVATYIHHAFYSEAARVRNRPPRISLARLTGPQLRQSYADLFGHFHNAPGTEAERGVQAVYFDGAEWKNDRKRIQRVDPVIDFDFADKGPGKGINAKDFYINWTGSVYVDRSGRYEIILRSSCSCMMYFGDEDRELFNNHVQSEGREEFRRTMHLTGGRAYSLKIDFFQRKRKTQQPPAKISLSWIPPGGIEEIIPHRHLIPREFPPTFAVQAKLPADDRSYGYERGTSIDRGWDKSTTDAALEFAQIAADELFPQYKKHRGRGPDAKRNKLRWFLREVLETAFRGPLDDETSKRFIDQQLEQTEDDAEAIKRVLLLALKSPRFLYPTLDGDRSESRRVANRLALVLFDSLPSDRWLIKLVEKNKLQSSEQISEAAWRMVDDYRTRAKTRSFLYEWFDIAQLDEIVKDPQAYPGFDPPLVSDLSKSFAAFIDEVTWGEASDFRQLLQADWMYSTDRIEAFYGPAWKPGGDPANEDRPASGLRRSVADADVHVGAITHPLLMSNFAYHQMSSPIHRGVFLNRHLLGRVIRPPQAAFTPLNPDLHADLTTRQRVELQTGEVNCQVCHEKINSLGFALENFDAAGRYRTREKEQAIDASGRYNTRSGDEVSFRGARELGDFLATSPDCQQSFVEAAFEHFVKQPVSAFGPQTSDRLTKSFQESDFNIQQLIVSIAVLVAEREQEDRPNT